MSFRESVGFERLSPGHRHALPDSRRAGLEELQREIRTVSQSPVVTAVLNVADAALLVLNAQRQVVAFNSQVARVAKVSDVFGCRPGEALACVNAQGPGGCGTAPACETCGALGAILACQGGRRPVEAECLIRTEAHSALEFNVRASPVVVEGRPFTVVSLRDISSEKRREALEQIFFHDVLNTVAGLRSWTALLRRPGADSQRPAERIDALSRQLEREIRDQRALLEAENGTLVANPLRIRAADVLREIEGLFASHFAAQGRRLELEPVDPGLELETDLTLLSRVLVNMVRNALEAAEPGGTVRVGCGPLAAGGARNSGAGPPGLRFTVRNGGVISTEVRDHLFQRSFSTKARHGRGLGTYSMKLLGERYLSGKVSFTSDADSGTAFFIDLPLECPRAAVTKGAN